MAINMLSENEYISCPKCKNKTFKEENSFILKRTQTPTGIKLKQEGIKKIYLCTKCNEDITNVIKNFEII